MPTLHAPSDAQWDAIRCTDEHLMINAGAGTGKTFTVVSKILYLLGVEIRDETIAAPMTLRDVAAITYTNKAASELKEKLRTSLRDAGRRQDAYHVDTARVGTIHSFCGDILREFALRSARSPAVTLTGDAESRVMEAEAVRDALLDVLETNSIPALTDVLSEWPVKDVQRWTTALLGHGDNLAQMLGHAGNAGVREQALLRLASRAHAILLDRMDEAGQMDYDRMIVWTRDLLRDDATVRKALQRRIRLLIIDECQDVDPIQREIAYLLADPTRRRTDTTRLVLVGDPKQSIYRFRKADVTVWRSIETDLVSSGTGRVINLAESRRSIGPVLGFVDHFIGRLLDAPSDTEKGLQNFEVPYAPLTTLRGERREGTREGTREGHGVELIAIPGLEDGKACNAATVRQTEARAIARRIGELRSEGFELRDMAVLLTGWRDMDVYMDALREAGIHAYSLRAEGFWACREVLDITVALAAILNPSDDRMLFGFLRSPFVGLSDETLLRIAQVASTPYWPAVNAVTLADSGEQGRLKAGVELLQRFGALRDRVALAELIEDLLACTGYMVHLELLGYTSDGEPDQRIANIRKLVQLAGAHGTLTVDDFLELVTRERDLEVREGEARLHGERDNVVTVTSVHSAKGLEWRVVFWADLIRGSNPKHARLLIHGTDVVLGECDVEPKDQAERWQSVRRAIVAEENAETVRVWYVAATRARDLLVLAGVPLGKTGHIGGSPAEALRTRFGDINATTSKVQYTSASGVEYSAVVLHAEPLADDSDRLMVEQEEVLEASGPEPFITPPWTPVTVQSGRGRYSASELMSFQRCERRHWLKRVAGLCEPVAMPGASDRGDAVRSHGMSAVQYGVMVHDVLEHADGDTDIRELVDDAISRWDGELALGVDSEEERSRLVAEIERTLARPEYRIMRDAPGAKRELAFTFIEPDGCLEGTLDLVAPSDDGYSVLDIKTGRNSAGEAGSTEGAGDRGDNTGGAARYALQRTVYTRAVATITGKPVSEFIFDFTASGSQSVSVPTAGSMAADEVMLVTQLAQLRNGGSERTPNVAECRFCGFGSVGWCPGANVEA